MINDDWRSLTPYEAALPEDPRIDKVVPTYEATLGGPIFKDKLWFFGAGRFQKNEDSATFHTNIAYPNTVDDKRYEEADLRHQPAHSLKGAYTYRMRQETNNVFGDVMDRDSFYDNEEPTSLLSANYWASSPRTSSWRRSTRGARSRSSARARASRTSSAAP